MPIAESISLEREMRATLRPMRAKHTSLALLIFVFDIVLYAAFTNYALTSQSVAARIAFGLLAGVSIAMLFVVGHDACHGSYTRSRTLTIGSDAWPFCRR